MELPPAGARAKRIKLTTGVALWSVATVGMLWHWFSAFVAVILMAISSYGFGLHEWSDDAEYDAETRRRAKRGEPPPSQWSTSPLGLNEPTHHDKSDDVSSPVRAVADGSTRTVSKQDGEGGKR